MQGKCGLETYRVEILQAEANKNFQPAQDSTVVHIPFMVYHACNTMPTMSVQH